MSRPISPVPLAHLDIRLVDSVSEAQARAIWHAVAKARTGRFDALAAHAELVEEMLERLGDRQT